MRTFVLWLLRFLEQGLDTDLKQRLADYQAERARVEEDIRREKLALEADAEMLAMLKAQRARVQQDTKNTEDEIAKLKQEVHEIDSEKVTHAGAGDSDVLRGDL